MSRAQAEALQRILDVTRRFFEIEPAPGKVLRQAARSYPVPAPAAWRWWRRDGVEPPRWYHNEFPYGASSPRRGGA